MTIERTDLDSGLTVVTEQLPGARSASLGCWVRVGSRDESLELGGVSHFLEHLLFKGTATRTGREISEAIESVGGEMNAHTSHEHTAFYTRVPASAAALGLELLLDVVTGPAFDVGDVESERQVILEELHLAEDEGEDRVLSLAHERLWGTHPLGREVLGTIATIEAMDRDTIRGFFDQHYHPANLVLVGAGAVSHADLVAAAAMIPARTGGERPERTAPPIGAPGSVNVLRRSLEQAHLALVWPALHQTHPDRYALAVVNQILGGGLSSRLFQEVRETRGLAYSVFSSVAAYHEAGSLVAYAGTGPDLAPQVRDLVAGIAAELAADGATERESAVARGYLEGASLLGLEDSGSVMARLGNHMCARGTVTSIDHQIEALRAVTPDDVDRVAREILGTEPIVCAVGALRKRDLTDASRAAGA